MAADSLTRLDPDSSALRTVRSKASSVRGNRGRPPREAVHTLFSWVRDDDYSGVGVHTSEIDYFLSHSITDDNFQFKI